MTRQEELKELVDRVAGWARDGEQVEAYASRGTSARVVVYGGDVESLSTATSAGIGIRVVHRHRQGFAYAGSLDLDIVEETLDEARDNAAFASEDEHVGVAVPDGVAPPDVDLWSDEVDSFPTERKIAVALDLEQRVLAGDPRIRSVHSIAYSDGAYEYAIASSAGISAAYAASGCYMTAYALAGDDTETQAGYSMSGGRGPSDVDLDRAAREAVERATRMLGARKPPSGRATVVFDREVTAMLLGILGGTLSGEAVLKGRSMFANRLGEAIAAPGVTLVDDPTDSDAFGAAAYDDEGIACRRNALITDGVLGAFLYDSYSARRAGVASTGSAVRAGFKSGPGVGARALALRPGDRSQDEIVRAVSDGVLVQSVSGVHSGVNPVSGDFSVGAEGLVIRDGEVAEPVREFTIASALPRMLRDVAFIGNDHEWLPGGAAGVTIAIENMTVGGA